MTTSTDPVGERALVGVPQIAELANVGRSAVGNWRKRHPDFPAPKMQAPSGALFDLREVEDWLIEQGKISRRAPASARLWGMADAAREVWRPEEFVRFGVAFLVYLEACARARGENPPDLELPPPSIPAGTAWTDLRSQPSAKFMRAYVEAARTIEAANPELAELLDPRLDELNPAVDQLAYQVALTLDAGTVDQSRLRCAMFDLLSEVTTSDRSAGEHATPADLAHLVARLADFHGGVAIDPVVGEARLLWQTAYELPLAAETLETEPQIVGIDINREAWRRSRSRFYLYGRRAEIRNENALQVAPASLPKADLVVADPPLGLGNWGDADLYVDPRWRYGPPPPRSADFAWLQFAAHQLKPTGRAAILLGTGSLFKGGREGAIRQRMVEAGVVEAVIALPPRLRPNTSLSLALWLLRSPEAPTKPEEILLVDASDLAERGRSRFSLPESSIDRIFSVVFDWRSMQQIPQADRNIAASVPVSELAADGADLTPAKYRQRPHVSLGRLEETTDTLRRSLKENSAAATQAYADLLEYLERRT